MRVHVLAALGLPLWTLCIWPGFLSGEIRRLVLVAWAFCALAAGAARVQQWRHRWKRDLMVLQLRGERPDA